MLNSHDPDPCCGKFISDDLRSGALDEAYLWTCPECGIEWRPLEVRTDKPVMTAADNPLFRNIEYPVFARHWSPHPAVAIVR